MSKYEVSGCVNDFLFVFSGVIVNADSDKDALREYIKHLKDELDNIDVDKVFENVKDGYIWEVLEV